MLLDSHEDPKLWRYKRRGTVLGKWHQIKLELWERHDYECCLSVDHEERLAIECEEDQRLFDAFFGSD